MNYISHLLTFLFRVESAVLNWFMAECMWDEMNGMKQRFWGWELMTFCFVQKWGLLWHKVSYKCSLPPTQVLIFLWLLNYWLNVLNWIGLNVWNHVMEVDVFFLVGSDRFLNCGDRCWELSILVSSNLLSSHRTSIILHFVLDNSCLRSSVKPTHRLPMHQSQQSVANWIASRHFLISCLGSKKNLPRMDSFTASFASVENTPQRFSSFSRTMPSHRSFLLQCFDRPTDWLTVVFRSLLRAPKFSQVHFVQTQHFFCAFVCKANCTEQRAVFFSFNKNVGYFLCTFCQTSRFLFFIFHIVDCFNLDDLRAVCYIIWCIWCVCGCFVLFLKNYLCSNVVPFCQQLGMVKPGT